MNENLDKEKSNYLLKWALEEQMENDPNILHYPSDKETKNFHTFSNKHYKKMKKLYKMAEKAERISFYKQKYHQIAVGIITFLCISLFTITQVEAVHLPLMNFFIEIKEKCTIHKVKEERNLKLTKKYKDFEPGYTPDGFNILEVNENNGRFYIAYFNENENKIYTLYFFEKIVSIAVDTENAVTKKVNINGNIAYLTIKGESIRILFDKDGHRFYLDGNLSEDNGIKIIESIK